MKNIVAIVALQVASVGGIVSDYCLVSQDRCDKDGIYKYKGITSYQDFIIRDKLDSELENIKKNPWLALKRSQQTLETNPNSSRAIMNQIDVLRYLITKDPSNHSSYLASILNLCSSILSLPEMLVPREIYKLVCKLSVGSAQSSRNATTIIKATSDCLAKPHYLDAFTLTDYRIIQLQNMFIEKDFEGAMESFQFLSRFVRHHRDWRDQAKAEGRKADRIPQIPPTIAVLGHVIEKIVESHREDQLHSLNDIKDEPSILSEADLKFITSEKNSFAIFIEICKGNGFSEEILHLMRSIADTPGVFESSLQYYQHRRPAISINDIAISFN